MENDMPVHSQNINNKENIKMANLYEENKKFIKDYWARVFDTVESMTLRMLLDNVEENYLAKTIQELVMKLETILAAIMPDTNKPETLKPVAGSDHLFVSPDGIVWNEKTQHVAYTLRTEKGTPYIYLDGNTNGYYVGYLSQIVAAAYVPNPNNYRYIAFKDGNYRNVQADNLEWSPIRYKSADRCQLSPV